MSGTHFLQSSDWAQFQQAVGHMPVLVHGIRCYIHIVGPFRYAYIARAEQIDQRIFTELKQQGFHWVRVEGEVHTAMHTVKTRCRQPQTTLIFDLTPSEDQMLEHMHSKTRYNIRLAERKEVVVKREKNIDIFWQLNEETTDRDTFKSHDKAYYEQFLAMPMCEQFTAYVGDTPLASILTVLCDGVMTYVHGASANAHRQVMAPYLLQWRAMQYAKENGAVHYDFWGISPMYPEGQSMNETCYNGYCWDVTHPWTGITRFKVGFGGDVVTYPDAQDVILRPIIYRLYTFIHRIRYGA